MTGIPAKQGDRSLFGDLRDRLRDPRGWMLDSSPWPLRRMVMARRFKVRASEIPNSARYICMRRPARAAFELGRELADKYGW